MRRTVLDASAILAALFREPGADVVETHYQAGIVSAVNLSEVAVKLSDRGMPDVEARNQPCFYGHLGAAADTHLFEERRVHPLGGQVRLGSWWNPMDFDALSLEGEDRSRRPSPRP